jgi:hypothetical protein
MHTQVAKANRVRFVTGWDIAVNLGVIEGAPQAAIAMHGLVDAALGWIWIRYEDRSSRAVAKDDRD